MEYKEAYIVHISMLLIYLAQVNTLILCDLSLAYALIVEIN